MNSKRFTPAQEKSHLSLLLTCLGALPLLMEVSPAQAEDWKDRPVNTDQSATVTQPPSVSGTTRDSSSATNQEQRLDEVLVTAQKPEERLQDVPISISVLSGNALDTATSQGVLDEL